MSEALTWDGEELTGAITAEDLSPLRAVMMSGANLKMPGAQGTRPYAPLLDELDVSLVWKISGRFDPDGLPHADREVGVEQNAEHYRQLFRTGGDPDTGEHIISLAYAGATYPGLAQCWGFAPVRTGPTTIHVVTRIVLSAGELDEPGS